MDNLSFESINLNNEKIIGHIGGKKFYPIFNINGEKYLYKPLSLTKPYVTDISLFGEVYWSFILNKYFDQNVPISRLAYLDNKKLLKNQEYYFNRGILVKYFLQEDEKLIDIIDYFNEHPDNYFEKYPYIKSSILDYSNYVPAYYDYTYIFNSELIKNNEQLGSSLAYQILLSMLRADQNFHYRNVGFIEKNDYICLHPPMDFEFSNMFLYTNNGYREWFNNITYSNNLPRGQNWHNQVEEARTMDIHLSYSPQHQMNLFYIIKNYPNVLNLFLKKFNKYKQDIDKYIVTDSEDFIMYYYNWHHNFYEDKDNIDVHKKNMLELSENVEKYDKTIVKDDLLNWINNDIKKYMLRFEVLIKLYMLLDKMGYDNMEKLTIEKISDILKMDINKDNLDSDEYYVKLLTKFNSRM